MFIDYAGGCCSPALPHLEEMVPLSTLVPQVSCEYTVILHVGSPTWSVLQHLNASLFAGEMSQEHFYEPAKRKHKDVAHEWSAHE
jgi:hypothetical protein